MNYTTGTKLIKWTGSRQWVLLTITTQAYSTIRKLDPHRVHCTQNSMLRLVTPVDLYTLHGKSLPFSPPKKWGEVLKQTLGRSRDGRVISNSLWPMIAVIMTVTRMDTPEWLLMQSLPVALWVLAITWDLGGGASLSGNVQHKMILNNKLITAYWTGCWGVIYACLPPCDFASSISFSEALHSQWSDSVHFKNIFNL